LQHLVAEGVGELLVLLREFAETVFRNPVIPPGSVSVVIPLARRTVVGWDGMRGRMREGEMEGRGRRMEG